MQRDLILPLSSNDVRAASIVTIASKTVLSKCAAPAKLYATSGFQANQAAVRTSTKRSNSPRDELDRHQLQRPIVKEIEGGKKGQLRDQCDPKPKLHLCGATVPERRFAERVRKRRRISRR